MNYFQNKKFLRTVIIFMVLGILGYFVWNLSLLDSPFAPPIPKQKTDPKTGLPISEPNILRINFREETRNDLVPFSKSGQVRVYDIAGREVASQKILRGSVIFKDLPSEEYIVKAEFPDYFTVTPCSPKCDPDIVSQQQYNRNEGMVLTEDVFLYTPGKLTVFFHKTATQTDIAELMIRYEITFEPARDLNNRVIFSSEYGAPYGTIKTPEGREKEVARGLSKEKAIEKIYLLTRHYADLND